VTSIMIDEGFLPPARTEIVLVGFPPAGKQPLNTS
jgi:hypothetical protein